MPIREKRLHISAGFVDYPIATRRGHRWRTPKKGGRELLSDKSVPSTRGKRFPPAKEREAVRQALKPFCAIGYDDAAPRAWRSWKGFEFFKLQTGNSRTIVWLLCRGALVFGAAGNRGIGTTIQV